MFCELKIITVLLSVRNCYMILEAVVQRCSVKKVFLEILQYSQENTCVRVSFLIKLQACNFIKKETLAQVFSVNFVKFLRTPFFIGHLWWLLLRFEAQSSSL